MNIIIQCQGKKKNINRFTGGNNRKVMFVADPSKYSSTDYLACRPDDMKSKQDMSWRQYIYLINQSGKCFKDNRVIRSAELYTETIYMQLVNAFGWENVFILSAGWGLIRSDFYIPYYNITFSQVNREIKYIQRKKNSDDWHDFQQLDSSSKEPLVYFGCYGYIPLLTNLTKKYKGKKIAFYAAYEAGKELQKSGFAIIKRDSYTNWHYKCAEEWCSVERLKHLTSTMH